MPFRFDDKAHSLYSDSESTAASEAGGRLKNEQVEIEKALVARIDKLLPVVETIRHESSRADTKALPTMRAPLVAEFPEAPKRVPEMQTTELGPATPSR